jgi:hypothetical protein
MLKLPILPSCIPVYRDPENASYRRESNDAL